MFIYRSYMYTSIRTHTYTPAGAALPAVHCWKRCRLLPALVVLRKITVAFGPFVCVCVYVSVSAWVRVSMCICACARVWVGVCLWIHGWVGGWMGGWLHVRVCVCMHRIHQTARCRQLQVEILHVIITRSRPEDTQKHAHKHTNAHTQRTQPEQHSDHTKPSFGSCNR